MGQHCCVLAAASARGHQQLLAAPHRQGQPLPVVPFLGQQLLELSQCHHAPLDQGAVGDGLPTEVIGDHDVLTGLGCATARPLLGLQPAGHTHKGPAQCQSGERSSSGPPRGAGGNAVQALSTASSSPGTQTHTRVGQGAPRKAEQGQDTATRRVQVLAQPLCAVPRL